MPEPSADADRPRRVAIVGAGPSGFYTAAALLNGDEFDYSIDLIDRQPAPYGLVRYGVAPDHPKIKAVARVFERIIEDDRVRYLGNVEVGHDLQRADLLAHYDQVVYAVGGESDRRLGLADEDLPGSHSSTALVAWYSGHPDFIDLPVDLSGSTAVVVGIGNVAMDVARVLARPAEDLATTDIADPALATLRESALEDLYVLARRGPAQAACTPSELKEIAHLEKVDLIANPADMELDEASEEFAQEDRQAGKNVDLLREIAAAPPCCAPRRIHLRFLSSPKEIVAEDGKVSGVRIERNRLTPTDSGYLQAVGTGTFEELPADLLVRAIGYRSLPLADLPFDDRRGIIPNAAGRILDPATEEPLPREYVVGWVKRGPTGLIGSNKPDGAETAAAMIEDFPAAPPAPQGEPAALDALLAERGVRVVRYADWQRIDAEEIARGKAQGRPRVKMVRIEEMLEFLDGA
ncbi:MAG: NADP oxidoreductase [Acidobacteriota bacterium]